MRNKKKKTKTKTSREREQVLSVLHAALAGHRKNLRAVNEELARLSDEESYGDGVRFVDGSIAFEGLDERVYANALNIIEHIASVAGVSADPLEGWCSFDELKDGSLDCFGLALALQAVGARLQARIESSRAWKETVAEGAEVS